MRVAIALAALVAVATPLAGAVLTVDCEGGGAFTTIQSAVDAAAEGDTILIAPCVYAEQVDASEKLLHFVGSGSDVTLLQWSGGSATLRAIETWTGTTYVEGMAVHNAGGGAAIVWSSRLRLTSCEIMGALRGAGGAHPYGAASLVASSCVAEDVVLSGGGMSTLSNCALGDIDINGYGVYPPAGQSTTLNDCDGDSVHVRCLGAARINGGSFAGVVLHGGSVGCAPELWASGGQLGGVAVFDQAGTVDIGGCDLSSLTCDGPDAGYMFRLTGSTVTGDVSIEVLTHESRIVHNTILGDFLFDGVWWVYPAQFQSNIVVGTTTVTTTDPLVISHNDFVGPAYISAMGDSVVANISADPLFCAVPDDLTLEDCSPCIGAAHDGGIIGALGVGCTCEVAVERTSWGMLKALYR